MSTTTYVTHIFNPGGQVVVLNRPVVNDEMFTISKEVYNLLQDSTLIHIDFFLNIGT